MHFKWVHIFLKLAVAERCSFQLFKDEAVLSFKIVYGKGCEKKNKKIKKNAAATTP